MTHYKIKKTLLLIIVAIFIVSFSVSWNIARASDISSALENLSASTNQLIEARDGSAAGVLSKEEDVARRKKVVSDVISLSLQEIESAREKLNTAKFDKEDDFGKIRKSMLDWIDSQEKWFRLTEERLSTEKLDLNGIRNLAKEIKVYRDEKYNEEMANILNFILAIETQRLTDAASNRWNRISADLRRIERAGLIRNNLFAAEMEKAKKMIDGSRVLVERSFSITKEIYLPPVEKPEAFSDKKEVIAEELPSIRDLCEAAIVNLRSAYGEFVKISVSVRRLLRLP